MSPPLMNKKKSQNCIKLCYTENNLKNVHARIMVRVHDTTSECALKMYKVSLKLPLMVIKI